MIDLSHERLLTLLSYDPETGKFSPKVGRRGVRADQPLGHVEENGYRRIMVDGARCLAHRLAWFFVNGHWPASDLDHINGNPDDNRIQNLREASRSQNVANTRPRNKHGLKGAHFNRFKGKWQSYIRHRGKAQFLGFFDSAEAAHAAYMRAARSLHGEYARGTIWRPGQKRTMQPQLPYCAGHWCRSVQSGRLPGPIVAIATVKPRVAREMPTSELDEDDRHDPTMSVDAEMATLSP